MKNEIINAIFAEWTNHDFNKVSRETIEEVAFKSGFQMCIDLFTGRLLTQDNTEV